MTRHPPRPHQMAMELDPAKLQEFSNKHCRGKVVRLDMVRDMARALGLRISIELDAAEMHDRANKLFPKTMKRLAE